MKIPAPKKKKSSSSKLLYPDSYYEDLLKSYFRLEFDLDAHYAKWSKAHQHFATNVSEKYQNIRQLDIDVVENLLSFICSQNNNISRISSLVNKLCVNYGEKICEVDGQEFYACPVCPVLSALAKDGVEENLRNLGFGYRAKYIQKSSEEIIAKGGLKWFQQLREMSYEDAHTELMTLTGIGPKVADCICLMSLNQLSAVPVDTHIIQIAKHYLPEVGNPKSLTPTLYRKIGNEFRRVYGEFSGWAQTVLFVAELSGFKEKAEKSQAHMKSKKQKKS